MCFQLALVCDFLCSVKLQKLHKSASALGHGIWGNSLFPGYGHSKQLQDKLSLIPFKMRAVGSTSTEEREGRRDEGREERREDRKSPLPQVSFLKEKAGTGHPLLG